MWPCIIIAVYTTVLAALLALNVFIFKTGDCFCYGCDLESALVPTGNSYILLSALFTFWAAFIPRNLFRQREK